MLKNTFSKYIFAFVVIILISFLVLSGIITSLIYSYATEKKETDLISTSNALATPISNSGVEDINAYIVIIQMSISPMLNRDDQLDILITDASGKVLLSSLPRTINQETGER